MEKRLKAVVQLERTGCGIASVANVVGLTYPRAKSIAKPYWITFVRRDGRSYVLDSKQGLRTNCRTDFGRMKPGWYLPIKKR